MSENPLGFLDKTSGRYEELSTSIKILSVLKDAGYEMVATPTVEYIDTYKIGFDNTKEEEMYKFTDSKGKILTLRSDMTIPIARHVASRYANVDKTLRFSCYGDVYKINPDYSGGENQRTQIGVELIDMEKNRGNIEIISLVEHILKNLGIKDYIFEIGNVSLFDNIIRNKKSPNIQKEDIHTLANLIDKKSISDLKIFLQEKNYFEKDEVQMILNMPFLNGTTKEVLTELEKYSKILNLKPSIDYMKKLYQDITKVSDCKNIVFDMGKIPKLNYYTDIIFEVFVKEIPESLISGGRYDALIGKFGAKEKNAIGFCIKIDMLEKLITRKELKC